MTVFFDDGKADPGTHVLLIGVGSYPFLKDGTSGQTFAMNMGMGQLTSPPVSVRDLANWFTDPDDGFNNPDRPLRSLEVLCSDTSPFSLNDSTAAAVAVERARMPAVKQAVINWKNRAGRNTENLAVFYFCGHGLAFGEAEHSLLLEDFGSNPDDPMDDAIAFDQMRMGLMRHCETTYQCHFIDACRTPLTKEFLDAYGSRSTGVAIVAAGLSRQLRDKIVPVYFATGLGAPAYGFTGQASLFTQGLLQSMRGPASRNKDDYWEVQLPALAEGINKCVATLAFQAQPQYCNPRDTGPDFTLHRLRAEPEVVVKVFTRDPTLLPNAVLAHVQEPQGIRTERVAMDRPWWVALTTGQYRFEARAAANTARLLGEKRRYVAPPGAEVGL